MKTAVDTSVLVAALASWHEDHAAAAAALEGSLGRPGDLVIPADAIVESYSVLTRLPAPHRLATGDALRVLEESFGELPCVGLTGAESWRLLRRLASERVAGGAVYDARIVAEAAKGGAVRILTLNPRHFERLAPEGLAVVKPG